MADKRDVIIGGTSAIEFWRRAWLEGNGSAVGLLGHAFPDDLLEDLAANPSLLEDYAQLRPGSGARVGFSPRALASLLGLSQPVELAVCHASARRRPDGLDVRMWPQGLVEGLVVHLEDNLYVCVPELAFAQLAGRLSRAELVELAFELCGDYVRLDGALFEGRHLGGEHALSSPCRLRAACELFGGFRGAQNARTAAEVALANSWSPRESQLAALMTLSRPLGGYGCPAPVLNERVYLEPELARIADRGYVVPDILYRDGGFCLEYQGSQHGGSMARGRDDAKGNVLLMMGIETVRVWDEQLYDIPTMDGIAAYAYKKLGIWRRPASVKMLARQSDLVSAFRMLGRRR